MTHKQHKVMQKTTAVKIMNKISIPHCTTHTHIIIKIIFSVCIYMHVIIPVSCHGDRMMGSENHISPFLFL